MLEVRDVFVLIYTVSAHYFILPLVSYIYISRSINIRSKADIFDIFFLDIQKFQIMAGFILDMSLTFIIVAFYYKFLFNEINKLKKNHKIYFRSILCYFICNICLIAGSIIAKSKKTDKNKTINQSSIETSFKIYPVTMFLLCCLIGPFNEEIIYRKVLYMNLRGKVSLIESFKTKKRTSMVRIILSMIFSSFVFALIHIRIGRDKIGAIIPYFINGLIFVIIYELSNIFYAAMTVHMMHNVFSTVTILFKQNLIFIKPNLKRMHDLTIFCDGKN